MKNLLLFLFILGISPTVLGQNIDADNIKSVVFQPKAVNSYTPIIRLGEKLILSFDDLNADEQDYYYKIEHCEYDWTPSKIANSKFINGFAEDRIREYNNSFNTLLPYTNYQLAIPNESTSIKTSGNYMLYVYNESKEIAFKRRFVIYEPKVTVAVSVHKSRNIANINTHQIVQFTINNGSFRVNNPSQEIKPVILQNNNWKTAISGLKPQFFRNNQLLYLYNKETSYWGGNEFLYFDTKAIRDATLNIARVESGENLYHTYLYTDEATIGQPYSLNPDINGNFIIRTIDMGENQDIEADYSWVFFSLKSDENPNKKDIYVSGKFNNWQLTNENKLEYNQKNGLYEGAILMKQGFYNYQYITKNKKGDLSNFDINGSYYQTENNYTVIAYYKPFGARYTRVIGVGLGSSKVILN